MLKRLARKHFKRWNGILLCYIRYNPNETGKNMFTHMLHPDIEQDEELSKLLKQVADKVREFYKMNPNLLEEVGVKLREE